MFFRCPSWTAPPPLPPPRQVKLELIRQAESFEQVKEILEEHVGEAGSSSADPSWASEVNQDQNTASPKWDQKKKANLPSVLDPVVVVSDHVLLCYETLSSTKVISDGQSVDLGNTFVL